MISVVILTKNEEQDLPECLTSVKWCDDVHIFDSFSTDNTVAIAEKFGAKITQRTFDNYASQRNASLSSIVYKHDWILILDADERIPKELHDEFINIIPKTPDNINGFRIQRRDYLYETWLKHAQITPYYIRLIRKGKAKYHREINEVIEVEGEIQNLTSFFIHFPFSKGMSHWLNKHNQYSSMEAKRWMDENNNNFNFSLKKALFSNDFNEKRYNQKGIYYKFPMRPLLKFFYMFFVRRAFLDGKAGVTYAILQSIYEYFIVLKTKELIAKNKTHNKSS